MTTYPGAPISIQSGSTVPASGAPISIIGGPGQVGQPGLSFLISASQLAFWNATMKPGDLAQALQASKSQLSLVTVGQCSPLAGTPLTDTQITQAIADCVPGGLRPEGCAYLTWSDETTTVISELLNGHIDDQNSTRLLAASIDNVTTTVTVQNGALFGTTTPFLATIEYGGANPEVVQVTNVTGTTTKTWTVTRNWNGAGAFAHNSGVNIIEVYALNGGINNSVTSCTLQDNINLTPTLPYSMYFQDTGEVINVTAQTGTSLSTIVRGASSTTPQAHADKAIMRYVWSDPGIISLTNQAHAQGVRVMFAPLRQTWDSVLTSPTLATTADAVLYEAQRLQDDANFVSEVAATIANIRTAGGANLPIMVQFNAYDTFNSNAPYLPEFVEDQMIQVYKAVGGYAWGSVEFVNTASTTVMQQIMQHFRQP